MLDQLVNGNCLLLYLVNTDEYSKSKNLMTEMIKNPNLFESQKSQVESFRHDLMCQFVGTQEILCNINLLYEIYKKHIDTLKYEYM